MKRELISNGNPLEDIIDFSRAVKVGSHICIGGTAPVDQNGKTVGIGDVAKQTKHCLEIIDEALKKAGSRMEHIVRSRILLTNIDDWKEVIKVRTDYFKKIKPVDTVMQVSRFINPEWLIEIEVDAIISE